MYNIIMFEYIFVTHRQGSATNWWVAQLVGPAVRTSYRIIVLSAGWYYNNIVIVRPGRSCPLILCCKSEIHTSVFSSRRTWRVKKKPQTEIFVAILLYTWWWMVNIWHSVYYIMRWCHEGPFERHYYISIEKVRNQLYKKKTVAFTEWSFIAWLPLIIQKSMFTIFKFFFFKVLHSRFSKSV